MKKTLFSLIAFIALASSCTSTPTVPQTPTDITVMAWNIWHEGQHKALGDSACDATLEILKTSQADILTIVETYGAATKIADKLGYYHRLLSSNLSIYSRYPITKTLTFSDSISTFNFGGVELDVNGRTMRVFATWLHYLPDCTKVPTNLNEAGILEWETNGSRDNEIRTILNCIKPYLAQSDSIPVIMAGDFNTHSHLDWTEETKNLYHHGGKVINWPVSKEMESAHFTDSYREANPDPSKSAGTTWLISSEPNFKWNRSDRIDYIYYSGSELKATSSASFNTNIGDSIEFKGSNHIFGSDHGFVLTTFSYTPTK